MKRNWLPVVLAPNDSDQFVTTILTNKRVQFVLMLELCCCKMFFFVKMIFKKRDKKTYRNTTVFNFHCIENSLCLSRGQKWYISCPAWYLSSAMGANSCSVMFHAWHDLLCSVFICKKIQIAAKMNQKKKICSWTKVFQLCDKR